MRADPPLQDTFTLYPCDPCVPGVAPLNLLPPLAAVPETLVPAQPEHRQLRLYPDLLHLRPDRRRNFFRGIHVALLSREGR